MSEEFDALLDAFGRAREDMWYEEFSRPRGCEDYFSRYLRDRAEATEQALRDYVAKLEAEREAGIQYARAEYERHCRRSEQGNKRLLKMDTKGDIF